MRRLVATVLTAASLVMATSATAEAAAGPVRSLSMTSTYAGQGTCEVRFTWTPRTTVDHFEYVVTDVRPDLAGDWQPGASTTTNLGVKRTVPRGHGLWLTLTAVPPMERPPALSRPAATPSPAEDRTQDRSRHGQDTSHRPRRTSTSGVPEPRRPGMYDVAFSWVPGSDVPVDHYRVILTEHPIIVTPRREHWAEVRNLSGWLSWPVHPGEGLWVTVTAVERRRRALLRQPARGRRRSPADAAALRPTGPAAPA